MEGLGIRVTHGGTTTASILLDDIADGSDNGGASGLRPGPVYVPSGGFIDLIYTQSVALSFESGSIRKFIQDGVVTAIMVLGSSFPVPAESLATTLAAGNVTGGTDILLTSGDALAGADAPVGSGLDGDPLYLRPGQGDGAGVMGSIYARRPGDTRGHSSVDLQLVGSPDQVTRAPYSGLFAGYYNTIGASGWASVIAGGRGHFADEWAQFIGGGYGITLTGGASFALGGLYNVGTGYGSGLLGGIDNQVNGDYSVVAGGYQNVADGLRSFIGGGYNNTTAGADSAAFGRDNQIIAGDTALVFGSGNTVNKSGNAYGAVAGGDGCTVTNYNAQSFGYNTVVSGGGATGFGWGSIASGAYAFATGGYVTVSGDYSAGFGYQNTVAGSYSLVAGQNHNLTAAADWAATFGYQNALSERYTFAAGSNNTVSERWGAAFGQYNVVSGQSSFTAGESNTVSGRWSAAFGQDNTVGDDYAFAAGGRHNISGFGGWSPSGGLGFDSTVSSYYSWSMGGDNVISGGTSFAHGWGNTISGYTVAVFGTRNLVSNNYSFATGTRNTITEEFGWAFGNSNTISGYYSLGVGLDGSVSGDYSFGFGRAPRADLDFQFVRSATVSGASTPAGQTQISELVLGARTSNGAQTRALNGAAGDTTSSILMPLDYDLAKVRPFAGGAAWGFDGEITAFQVDDDGWPYVQEDITNTPPDGAITIWKTSGAGIGEGTVNYPANLPIIPGTFTVWWTQGGGGSYGLTDDGAGNLKYGASIGGTIDYQTGEMSFDTTVTPGGAPGVGTLIRVDYSSAVQAAARFTFDGLIKHTKREREQANITPTDNTIVIWKTAGAGPGEGTLAVPGLLPIRPGTVTLTWRNTGFAVLRQNDDGAGGFTATGEAGATPGNPAGSSIDYTTGAITLDCTGAAPRAGQLIYIEYETTTRTYVQIVAGPVVVTTAQADTEVVGWTVAVTADTTLNALEILVTQPAVPTTLEVDWTSNLRLTQVASPN
jgi:hypothetical protein